MCANLIHFFTLFFLRAVCCLQNGICFSAVVSLNFLPHHSHCTKSPVVALRIISSYSDVIFTSGLLDVWIIILKAADYSFQFTLPMFIKDCDDTFSLLWGGRLTLSILNIILAVSFTLRLRIEHLPLILGHLLAHQDVFLEGFFVE